VCVCVKGSSLIPRLSHLQSLIACMQMQRGKARENYVVTSGRHTGVVPKEGVQIPFVMSVQVLETKARKQSRVPLIGWDTGEGRLM